MKYKKYYELKWTWRYVNSVKVYTDHKDFSSEAELNKYTLDLFADITVEILWCEKNISEVWSLT